MTRTFTLACLKSVEVHTLERDVRIKFSATQPSLGCANLFWLSLWICMQVSMRHASLFRENGDFWLMDLGSAEGTWLNGNRIRIQQKQKVTPGDVVSVGRKNSEELTFKVKMVHPTVWDQVQDADKGNMDAPAEAEPISA